MVHRMSLAAAGRMNRPRTTAALGLLTLLGLLVVPVAVAELLKPAQQRAVRAATYEVVVPKIAEDPSIRYERELPFELLPWTVRNDHYVPIGTAFRLGDGEYVTAAHVLVSWMGSAYAAPRLRGADGALYDIDRILKFSLHEDFVVFSLQQEIAGKPLPVATQPAVDSVVHAVGNALGDGIVVRDGLLTSETPEQENGRWKWLRFSAAASPGNSGGPLLDEEGRVIGVVVAASPAENLNYALPVRHVLEAPATGRIDSRITYRLPVMQQTVGESLRAEFPLPVDLAGLSQLVQRAVLGHLEGLRSRLFEQHVAPAFSAADASSPLLHGHIEARMPRVFARGEDGAWSAQRVGNVTDTDLPHGGQVSAGAIVGTWVLRVVMPEDQSLPALVADPALQMHFMLRGLHWSRIVAGESIAITALGPAARDELHVDRHGRRWQLRIWAIPPADAVGITMTLPTPDGFVGLARLVPSGRLAMELGEMKLLSELFWLSYGGNLAQWREFMSLNDLRPAVFDRVRLEQEGNRLLRFHSPRFELGLDMESVDIRDQSAVQMDLGFVREGATGLVWDVTGLDYREHMDSAPIVRVRRRAGVSATVGGVARRDWEKMVKRQAPYHGLPELDVDALRVRTVFAGAATAAPEPAFLYEFEVRLPIGPESLQELHQQILDGFRVAE
ncbi:MAG: serine protease [Gammaproteobacteria bacterium]|nr:MAG: serine protease [Gammaproteobacteria bacterium]